jgi:peptidoglycan/LPS O-acetylase OafA/YrhL
VPLEIMIPSRRLRTLDALRGIAVLLVLGRHVVNSQRGIPAALSAILRPWKRFGWVGVDLFFVLSGFLVSGLLFAEYQKRGELRPLRFLGRRGFKIYPAFYLLLIITWFLFRDRLSGREFLHEALFIQNYTTQIWGHTWSLAVEEHFYIALAIGLWGMSRWIGGADPFRRLPLVFTAVAALVFALRVRAYSLQPTGWLLLPTHLRVDALLFGALIGYGWAFHRPAMVAFVERYRGRIALAVVILLLPCLLLPVDGNFLVNTVGLSTNYLGFGGLVLLAVAPGDEIGSGLRQRALAPLVRLGFYSYSIYLWHMPIRMLTTLYLPALIGWTATLAAYFAGSIVVGIIAARLIEMPFLRLRERLLPSQPPGQPAARRPSR